MSEWITAREAAEILGVHKSNIPKMARRGELTRRAERPVILRADVEALRQRRSQPKPLKPPREPKPARVPQPPDRDHDWLNSDEAAVLLGQGRSGVNYRVHAGKLPNELHGGRRWFRRDHLELVKRADAVKRGAATVGRGA